MSFFWVSGANFYVRAVVVFSMEKTEVEGEHFNGKHRTQLTGPFKRSVDDLPTFGLVNNSKTSGGLHRPMMGGGSDRWGDEVRPACSQQKVERQEAINGAKYVQDWTVVRIARRLPFAKYHLCGSPGCFRHVELVDSGGD